MSDSAGRCGTIRLFGALGTVLLVVVLLIVWSWYGHLNRGRPGSNWVTYSAPDGFFTVEHPSNLTPSVQSQNGADGVLFRAGTSGTPSLGHVVGFNYSPTELGLGVLEVPVSAPGEDASSILDSVKARVEGQAAYREIPGTPLIVDGVSATTLAFSLEMPTSTGGFHGFEEYAAFESGGRILVLAVFAPADEFDFTMFSRFANSLKVRG